MDTVNTCSAADRVRALEEALEINRKAQQAQVMPLYRAECRVTCLEAMLKRIDYSEFDSVMEKLEEAKKVVQHINAQKLALALESTHLDSELWRAREAVKEERCATAPMPRS